MNDKQESAVRAFLLGRVPYGEADLIVHVFSEAHGKISALARGARRSQKRFSGSLEPLHTLRLQLTEKASSELFTVREASIERPRLGLVRDLDNLDRASQALGWLRRALPPRTPEPALWFALEEFLNHLDNPSSHSPQAELVVFGLHLLQELGFALQLEQCVSCDKLCPPGQAAWLHPERGGLICRACGGGPLLLPGALRETLLAALQGETELRWGEHLDLALQIVERTLLAHSEIRDKSPRSRSVPPRRFR